MVYTHLAAVIRGILNAGIAWNVSVTEVPLQSLRRCQLAWVLYPVPYAQCPVPLLCGVGVVGAYIFLWCSTDKSVGCACTAANAVCLRVNLIGVSVTHLQHV